MESSVMSLVPFQKEDACCTFAHVYRGSNIQTISWETIPYFRQLP